jgi:SIR2-like domain
MRKKQISSHRAAKRRPTKTTRLDLLTLFPTYRKSSYKRQVEQLKCEYMEELREAYLHVGLVLYVGAGVSRSLGLPSWSELIRSLTLTMMTRKVQSAFTAIGKLRPEKYWQEIVKIQEDVEKGTDYDKPMLMMARAIKDELKDELPIAIIRTLAHHLRRSFYMVRSREDIAEMQGRTKLSPLMSELVSLARAERDITGVQAIVNYNYDDTLDTELRGNSVRCITVRSGKDKVPQGALPCYHVHGVLPIADYRRTKMYPITKKKNNYGNFVFSEDEYHAEYSDPYRWSNMTQISMLGRYTGLFVGLSLEDPNIRRLIDVTHRQYPEAHNYAILPRKKALYKSRDTKDCVLRNLFEQVETSSFEKIGVHVIWVDSYDQIPSILHEIYTGEKIKYRPDENMKPE